MNRRQALIGAFVFTATLACAAQPPRDHNSQASGAVSPTETSTLQSNYAYCQSVLPGSPENDALKEGCIFSLSLGQRMPDFTCDMQVEKYEDITRTYRSTQYMQKIQARARYVNGKDFYDDLRINGRPSTDRALIEGTWSFGEFGAKLLAAFDPKNHPTIKFVRSTNVNGTPAFEYEFHVEHKNNRFWRWLWEKRSTLPGYEGHLWLAKRDGMILRLHLNSTFGVPDDFPIQSVESTSEYSYVDFKDKSGFVLPSKVQIQTRMLDHRFYRTRIEFSHCHRFRVDSRILAQP